MSDPSASAGFGGRVLKTTSALAAVFGVASTGFGLYSSIKSQEAAESANQAKMALEAQKEEREALGADRDFSIRVFEKAYEALAAENPRQQEAALALVITLPASTMREAMIAAFKDSATTVETREQATAVVQAERSFVEQAALDRTALRVEGRSASAAPASTTTQVLSTIAEGFDIDVFWCEGDDPLAPLRAEKAKQVGDVLAALATSREKVADTTLGRVRVRPLPVSINAQPDYRYSSNAVNYDAGKEGDLDESKLAAELASRAGAAASISFDLTPGKGDTDYYLSVVLCGSPG